MASKENKNFNDLYKELEAMVLLLEQGDLPLEEAIKTYEKANGLVKDLNDKLERAREKIVVEPNLSNEER